MDSHLHNQNQNHTHNHNPNQDNAHNQQSHVLRDNYAFPAHSDTFNAFLHADAESAFSNPWDPDAFTDPQEPINGFNPSNHSWNPNTIQPSNLLPVSNYGVQSRNLDQTFSGNPSFNYSGFDSRSNLSLSTPSFDPNLTYGQVPLNDDDNFDFTRTQDFQRTAKPSETISPQALQNYPATFNHVQISDTRPVCQL